MNTLSDRVREAIGDTEVMDIAKACKISKQAVYKWMSHASKKIKGEHLVILARVTGYEAAWIISGTLPKRIDPKIRTVMAVMHNMSDENKNTVLNICSAIVEKKTKNDYDYHGVEKRTKPR